MVLNLYVHPEEKAQDGLTQWLSVQYAASFDGAKYLQRFFLTAVSIAL